jgi:hypothetical protein
LTTSLAMLYDLLFSGDDRNRLIRNNFQVLFLRTFPTRRKIGRFVADPPLQNVAYLG